MSEQSIIVIICAVIVSLGQIIVAWISHRTHKAVNSRMSGFLKTAEEKFMLKGEQKGAEDERGRQREQSDSMG